MADDAPDRDRLLAPGVTEPQRQAMRNAMLTAPGQLPESVLAALEVVVSLLADKDSTCRSLTGRDKSRE